MMAILGVLFAVVYMAVFYGGTAISVALTPLGLSAFGFELIYGVWFMAATIAAYIIRKPGAALITEVLASAIELLMGNSGGATVVLTGLIQGVGQGTGDGLAVVDGNAAFLINIEPQEPLAGLLDILHIPQGAACRLHKGLGQLGGDLSDFSHEKTSMRRGR